LVRSVGLWRTVVHRGRADWPVVTAAFVLLVCAITLLATGALYGDTVALGGLRQAVLAAPPADRAVLTRMSASATDIGTLDATVAPEIRAAISAAGGEVALVVRSGSLAPAGMAIDAARQHLTLLASYQDIERHAALTNGHWPDAGRTPIETTLSEAAAGALGLKVGDRVSLALGSDPSQTIDLALVGLWRPADDDPYWLGDRLELDGIRQDALVTTRGPFVASQADLASGRVARRLDLEWRAIPSIDGLRVDRIEVLRTAVEGVKPAIRSAVVPSREISVVTGLPAILTDASRSILVSRSGVAVLTLQFGVLAAYAILLVAGLLVERRRSEVALLRSRGATLAHLVSLAFGEAVLLAVPAAMLAPILAVAVVRLIGAVGPLGESRVIGSVGVTPETVTAAGLAGLAGIAVLTAPSLIGGGMPATMRAAIGRPVGRTLAQRLGIDLVLVVLAAIALWQLRLYGAPLTRTAGGVLGIDPLLVAAPAIGLLAGAVLATRVVPRLAEVGERILARRRGIVPPLGARQVARRPLRFTRAALLLVLAAALGTFAAASAATWARSHADQAAYRTAGDARVVLSDQPALPTWAIGTAYRSISGVTRAMPVSRQSLAIGRTVRDGRLLAVDPNTIGRIATFPPESGATSSLLRQLADARPTTEAAPIDGRPARLGITIDAAVTVESDASGPEVVPPGWTGVAVAVVLEDGDGRLQRIAAGELGLTGSGQRTEVALERTIDGLTVRPVYPLRLMAIELTLTPPPNVVMIGSVELKGVETSSAPSGESWTPIAMDPGAPGWTWTRQDESGTTVYRPPAGSPGRIEMRHGDVTSGPLVGWFDHPGATYRLVAATSGAGVVAAIAGDRLLDLTGAHVGDTIAVDSAAQNLTVRIVGHVADFPPLDPGTAFLVADGATLDLVAFSATDFPVSASEWWLSLDGARADEVAAILSAHPYSAAQVVSRTEAARGLARDPVWLGVVGALGLGALAALAFATIGFLVSATVSTGERQGELALLRALGLSGRQLSVWLSLEQVFLLAVGLVGGSLLGVLLAWLVLPYSTLSASGAPVVPVPVIVVPWDAILPVYTSVTVLLLATTTLLARRVPERSVSRILRAAGD
jgi:FtsX-like permease family